MQFRLCLPVYGIDAVVEYRQNQEREDNLMMEFIRYRILMLRLRGEIAAVVRQQSDCMPCVKATGPQLETRVKSTCKACESIV